MLKSNGKIQLGNFKVEYTWLSLISLGVFLFVLFFQPFPLEQLLINNRLIYVAGFGAITFVVMYVVFLIYPLVSPKHLNVDQSHKQLPVILFIVSLTLNITAFSFYIFYVGKTQLTLYVLFKIALVCLLPVIILNIVYKNVNLQQQVVKLKNQNNEHLMALAKFQKEEGENSINIFSGNKAVALKLQIKNIILIRSADNYIDIHYFKDEEKRNKLIRNTLKDLELQVKHQQKLLRCHRTCFINSMHIEKIVRQPNGYGLLLNGMHDKVPVSKQYLPAIKSAIIGHSH